MMGQSTQHPRCLYLNARSVEGNRKSWKPGLGSMAHTAPPETQRNNLHNENINRKRTNVFRKGRQEQKRSVMLSVPSQRYRFTLKFRPRQELDQLEVRRRWDKNMNTVVWVCYKAMEIRWRKLCRQLTRSKKPWSLQK